MAGTAGRHHAGTALSAGGSEAHVEPKPEARGTCECSAANEAAQHVAVTLLISVDLYCFPRDAGSREKAKHMQRRNERERREIKGLVAKEKSKGGASVASGAPDIKPREGKIKGSQTLFSNATEKNILTP